jgi:ribosomal protein S18 acetylase RimI-like enzyme
MAGCSKESEMTIDSNGVMMRPMTEADLEGVLAVQAACYPPAMQEAAAVVLARLRAAPGTTLVASDEGGVCAYVFAYPSLRGKVTPLGAQFALPDAPDTLYIHDLAVAPRALGRGLARGLAHALMERGQAHGLRHAALVSVQDSRRFWEGLGYRFDAARRACAALASYPDGALYMTRALS